MQNSKMSSKEIALIEKACRLTDKTFDYILGEIKPGVTEKEISLKIRKFINKNGALLSFRSIVAFGKNSSEPHHKPTETKLKKADIVLLDFGAKIEGYCSDMTRTVFMGRATDKQKRIYRTVLKAQRRAIKFLMRVQPLIGTNSKGKGLNPSVKEVDKTARDYIISQGYTPMPHGLGHGIGKKVHERPKLSPKSKERLTLNMVFSVEPGIYLKNFGGVRIEDTVVLEKTGLRILTKSTKGIIEL